MASAFPKLRPPDALGQLAQHNTLVPKPEAVGQYICQHPELGQLLAGICATARQFFGPVEELSLEVYEDPEIDDRYLTLFVRQDNYGQDTMDRIDKFRRQFDDSLEQVSGYLLVTTDFRRPRGSNGV